MSSHFEEVKELLLHRSSHSPPARESLIFARTCLDFWSDSSSCSYSCSGCNYYKNCSLDSVFSFWAGSWLVDLAGGVVFVKETLNSCMIAAASSVVASVIGNKHGAERKHHPLFLHGYRIHPFSAVVIDIYCLVDHVRADLLGTIKAVVIGLIARAEENVRMRDEAEQCSH